VKQVGNVAVVVDRRVERYTQWRDLTISARHPGTCEELVVVDALRVRLEMQAGNRRSRRRSATRGVSDMHMDTR
jgi:hypothetical protein